MLSSITWEQLLKLLGVAFIFGTTVAALHSQDKENSREIIRVEARVDGTLTSIDDRLERIENRLTELCQATQAGCR